MRERCREAIGCNRLARFGTPALARLWQLILRGDQMGEERRLTMALGRLVRLSRERGRSVHHLNLLRTGHETRRILRCVL